MDSSRTGKLFEPGKCPPLPAVGQPAHKQLAQWLLAPGPSCATPKTTCPIRRLSPVLLGAFRYRRRRGLRMSCFRWGLRRAAPCSPGRATSQDAPRQTLQPTAASFTRRYLRPGWQTRWRSGRTMATSSAAAALAMKRILIERAPPPARRSSGSPALCHDSWMWRTPSR